MGSVGTMDLKDLRKNIEEEIESILSTNFEIEITETDNELSVVLVEEVGGNSHLSHGTIRKNIF